MAEGHGHGRMESGPWACLRAGVILEALLGKHIDGGLTTTYKVGIHQYTRFRDSETEAWSERKLSLEVTGLINGRAGA